ncbi:MAG: metal ABC transporter permease [Muribaculaceae bacterium]|nr:metal ABC transporter permease [Muribaculaceae bacterium]
MTELLEYAFFRNAVTGITIISIAVAIIGTYIATRRLISISGGITHACFGGLGLGYYLGVNPVLMAAAFAVTSSLGVEWLSSRHNVREDSAIAVVWALGMAIGVLFVFLTPGYVPELNSFLFGNILTISASDLWAFAVYTVVLVAFFIIFYDRIVACAFDRDFARVSHLPVRFISYSMTVLVAVCIVLTIRMVGIMLLMSMLSLPQMIAEIYCRQFRSMTIASIGISLVCCLSGLMLATVIDVPCSAIIVILLVTIYIAARTTKAVTRRQPMQ